MSTLKVKTSSDTIFFRTHVARRRTLHHKVYYVCLKVFRVSLYVLSQLLTFWQFINKCENILGPKLNSVEDFWQMVWQENILLIAMVTNLTEGSSVRIFLTSTCVLLCRLSALAKVTYWDHYLSSCVVDLRRRRRRHKNILSHFLPEPHRPASWYSAQSMENCIV